MRRHTPITAGPISTQALLRGMAPELLTAGLHHSSLDRPAQPPPALRYLICSTPRSGSYQLCRLLTLAGLGLPNEYFHLLFLKQLSARLGLDADTDREPALDAYLELILSRRSHNGVFGAKLQYAHLQRYLSGAQALSLLDGAHYLYLYRENLVDQAVSLHYARLTSDWGIGFVEVFRSPPPQRFTDLSAVERCLEELLEEDKAWRRYFAERDLRPVWLSMEALMAEPAAQIRRITEALGLRIAGGALRRYLQDPSLIPEPPRAPAPPRAPVRAALVEQLRARSLLGRRQPSGRVARSRPAR